MVPLPSFSEQERLMKKTGAVNVRLQIEHALLRKLDKQRSGLMHDLLTGKVPVHIDPEDEPEAASA